MKIAILLLAFIALSRGAQKCTNQGGILKYNGQPCASTTRYDDGQKGACGCGDANSNAPFAWNLQDLVTAPNQMIFDDGGQNTWCGRNCGKCVQLTPTGNVYNCGPCLDTGGFVPGLGNAPRDNSPHIFMITNDCPVQGNEEWCGQAGKPGTNQGNRHGYEAHFDLQNNKGQVGNGLGWDNPEVTWQWIDCPENYKNNYNQCQCH